MATSDHIADFTTGLDVIDLRAIAGLTFIGPVVFSSIAGQWPNYAGTGALQGDTNGNAVAYFALVLDSDALVGAVDLLLLSVMCLGCRPHTGGPYCR